MFICTSTFKIQNVRNSYSYITTFNAEIYFTCEGKLAVVLDSTGISISCEFILFAFQVSFAWVTTVSFQRATSIGCVFGMKPDGGLSVTKWMDLKRS